MGREKLTGAIRNLVLATDWVEEGGQTHGTTCYTIRGLDGKSEAEGVVNTGDYGVYGYAVVVYEDGKINERGCFHDGTLADVYHTDTLSEAQLLVDYLILVNKYQNT